ncbi:hypothetical protein J2T12_000873 [Paenibacillus anaericanus]|uniref:DUF4176 domain-containing protein n=1 Tax=Paenibacillus anaericanus TaxID=170367 RepID=UPI0027874D7A|nr:DUF4176 domain-containing protein [Paenibacillus anaericanus]MDQ0087479.1 hypothetical protein [Paenibacillus anaericanus]
MEFLSNGSIVQLNGGQKKVMIFGRLQKQADTGQIWDYIACLYPEGNIDLNHSYLFNHDQIERIYFTGFQDKEELAYNQNLQEWKARQEAESNIV